MSQINFGILGIRPELLYDYVQRSHPDGNIETHNITVPLSLVLQTPRQSINEMDLHAGGYYSYRFAGTQGNQPMDFENIFNQHEAGLLFGYGMYIKPFRIGFELRIPLTDFSKSDTIYDAYPKKTAFFFKLTYTF
jgi:hypothetical protein